MSNYTNASIHIPSPSPHAVLPPVTPPAPLTQGGILNGVVFLSTDLSLFIVQLLLITLLSRLLGYLLKYIKQPRVIAEVIAGILLGPTALGHIPGFTNTIFPPARLYLISIVANIGLILFLFIVGLELNLSLLKTNIKKSLIISLSGMAFPFAMGAAVSLFLYNNLLNSMTPPPPLSSVILFVAVAMSITAFPVLARILTETKLLSLPVGLTAISAAAVDDAAAWCFLALVIAIVASQNHLNTLYIFLLLIAFVGVMFGSSYLITRRFKVPQKLTQNLVVTCLLVCFSAAWITDLIGVDSIFGAFITGLCLPRENNFSVQLIEKIEDLVTFIFLPLYFAASGLKTNLGLLNTGEAWAGVFLVIFTACAGKILGVGGACKAVGLSWRDSATVGFLMNTKGLVELIVLNIGLSAGIINPLVFTIMVVMALVTTFITSPVVNFIYPPRLRTQFSVERRKSKILEDGIHDTLDNSESSVVRALLCITHEDVIQHFSSLVQLFPTVEKQKILVHICRMDTVPERDSGILSLTRNLLEESANQNAPHHFPPMSGVDVHAERLITSLEDSSRDILEVVHENNLNIIFYPWHKLDEEDDQENVASILHAVCSTSPATVGILIATNSRSVSVSDGQGKIYVPFFGGYNDREAVFLALNFSSKARVVVAHYYPKMGTLETSENSDTHNEHAFSTVEDQDLMTTVRTLSEESETITFHNRKYNNPEEALQFLANDLSINYSWVFFGRNVLDGFNERDHSKVLGTLGAVYLEETIPSNFLIVQKSKRSPQYTSLPRGLER